jgi:actin-like ATPase involved in cell morphogenesis
VTIAEPGCPNGQAGLHRAGPRPRFVSLPAMPSFHLAVDYGTSTTVAFLRWPDGRVRPLMFDDSPLLPSAVYADVDGRLLTGRDAVRSARFDPGRFEANPKRRIDDGEVLLGDRVLAVEELIAATLGRVADEAARIAGGRPHRLTLTHPATWGELRRETLVRAAARAGLPPAEPVPEPVAAAAAFATVLGHGVPPGSSVVVYDLGAGTFDLSVVRREGTGFRTLATDGLVDIGGLDLDAVVVDLVRRSGAAGPGDLWRRLDNPADAVEQRAARELWDGAREAKEALSRHASAPVPVPGLAAPVHVTREELEAAALPVLGRTVAVTTATLRAAGPVAGLFLVGGSTRVPLVASILHRATGIAPTVIEQPELVVAEGALHVGDAAPAPAPPAAGPVPAAPVSPSATAPISAPPISAPPVSTSVTSTLPTVPPVGPGPVGPAPVAPAPVAPAPVAPAPVGPGPVAPGLRRRRNRVALATAGAAALVVLMVLGVVLWPDDRRDAAGDNPGLDGVRAQQSTVDAKPSDSGPPPAASASPTTTPTATAKSSATTRTSPAARSTGPVTVTAALVRTRLTYNGPCPPPNNTPILLTVDFTVSGPTRIEYHWKRDPGWDTEIHPLSMDAPRAGTHRANGGFYGGWSNTPGETIRYWVQLVVTKPVQYTSEQITWSTTCTTVA